MNKKAARRIAESELLFDTLIWAEESHAEFSAQYHSEVARFGDAGPGQGLALSLLSIEIGGIRGRINKLSHQLRIYCELPAGHPCLSLVADSGLDDIPF